MELKNLLEITQTIIKSQIIHPGGFIEKLITTLPFLIQTYVLVSIFLFWPFTAHLAYPLDVTNLTWTLKSWLHNDSRNKEYVRYTADIN